MIFDKALQVSDNQTLLSTGLSTNSIDLGDPTLRGQVGAGDPLFMQFNMPVAADFTTGDETYQFDLFTSPNSDLSSGTSLGTRAILATTLVAGFRFQIGLPKEGVKRYVGANYTLGGTTPILTVTAFLTEEEISQRSVYASGVNQVV